MLEAGRGHEALAVCALKVWHTLTCCRKYGQAVSRVFRKPQACHVLLPCMSLSCMSYQGCATRTLLCVLRILCYPAFLINVILTAGLACSCLSCAYHHAM